MFIDVSVGSSVVTLITKFDRHLFTDLSPSSFIRNVHYSIYSSSSSFPLDSLSRGSPSTSSCFRTFRSYPNSIRLLSLASRPLTCRFRSWKLVRAVNTPRFLDCPSMMGRKLHYVGYLQCSIFHEDSRLHLVDLYLSSWTVHQFLLLPNQTHSHFQLAWTHHHRQRMLCPWSLHQCVVEPNGSPVNRQRCRREHAQNSHSVRKRHPLSFDFVRKQNPLSFDSVGRSHCRNPWRVVCSRCAGAMSVTLMVGQWELVAVLSAAVPRVQHWVVIPEENKDKLKTVFFYQPTSKRSLPQILGNGEWKVSK